MIRQGAVRRASSGSGIRAGLRAGVVLVSLVALAACGGAAPLLHPAHPLPPDTVSFGAGVSGQFASAGADDTIDRGRAAAAGPFSDPAVAQAYADGVLTQALIGPGISPWVSARVGLPHSLEAGLTYTGRSLRIDGRHVIPWGDEWALSIGLGASAILLDPDSTSLDEPPDASQSTEAEFGLDASGWGGDLPVLVGYRFGNFVELWFGVRTGFEHISGELLSSIDDPASPRYEASGNRFWGGALSGFSLGIPPIWLRFELAGTFHHMTGDVTSPGSAAQPPFGEVEVSAWTLAPSGAILGKF
jgi:hypothetical protein